MGKMKIVAYKDEKFSSKVGEMVVQIDPTDYQGRKEVKYDPGSQQGQSKQSPVFIGYKSEEFTVNVTIDCTGVIEETQEADTVKAKIKQLEDLVYKYNGDSHQANFVELVWGALLFRGRLKEMKSTYGFFNAEGMPLRAHVNMVFVEFVNRAEADRMANRQSPDMSHVVVFRDGDRLDMLCTNIYGDPGLVDEVARVNGLGGFRCIKPGTKIVFPHMKKNG